jgi:hypothetical protein
MDENTSGSIEEIVASYLTRGSHEAHRRELLRMAGVQREDVQRYLMDLRSARPMRRIDGVMPRVRRRLREFIAYVGIALVIGCGSIGSSASGTSGGLGRESNASTTTGAPVGTATVDVPCFGLVPAAEVGDYYYFYGLANDIDCARVLDSFGTSP